MKITYLWPHQLNERNRPNYQRIIHLSKEYDVILIKRDTVEYSKEISETAEKIIRTPIQFDNRYLDYAFFYLFSIIYCAYLSLKGELDVVHTFPGPISHVGFLFGMVPGVFWVSDLLDDPAVEFEALENRKPYLKYFAYWLHLQAIDYTLPRADRTYIVGTDTDKSLAKLLIKKYDLDPRTVCATPNGVDVDETRRDCSRNSDTFRVFYVGSMQSIRGLDVLIGAVGRLNQQYDDVELELLGPVRREQDYRVISSLLESEDIDEVTTFEGRRVSHEKVLDRMCKADVCALPLSGAVENFRHTYPVKLFEYLAMGRAIVASDLPGIAEIIEDGHSGVLVQWDDEDCFAEALERIYEDEAYKRRLEQNATKRAKDFDWESIGEKVLRSYPSD